MLQQKVPPRIPSLHLNGHFPGEHGLAGFTEAKYDGTGAENRSYKSCNAPVKSSSPTNSTFYWPDALPVKALKGKPTRRTNLQSDRYHCQSINQSIKAHL